MQYLPEDDGHVGQRCRELGERPGVLVPLDRAECFALLAQRQVGRFAVVDRDELPFVVPVNYVMAHDTVVFRTHPGTKLDSLRRRPVAFQVDSIEEHRRTGWTVLIRGVAHEVSPHDLTTVEPTPWTEAGPHWIQVVPRSISGRRFDFDDHRQ